MKNSQIVAAMLHLVIVLPIWFYLLYKVLDAVNANELMWFLYWVYVPVGVFAAFLAHVIAKT